MQTLFPSLTALGGALLKVSAQASLLIALVLLVQWLGGKKLSPRVRYALWLLVVARLLLPVSDRKSTRLNSSHLGISYAVFCLKKKSAGWGGSPAGRGRVRRA